MPNPSQNASRNAVGKRMRKKSPKGATPLFEFWNLGLQGSPAEGKGEVNLPLGRFRNQSRNDYLGSNTPWARGPANFLWLLKDWIDLGQISDIFFPREAWDLAPVRENLPHQTSTTTMEEPWETVFWRSEGVEDAWEVFFPEILGGPWRNGLRERWFYRDFGGFVTQWALRAGISTHAGGTFSGQNRTQTRRKLVLTSGKWSARRAPGLEIG